MPLTQVFVSISDPRSARQVRHDLSELLTVAVCAVLCSADEFSDIEACPPRQNTCHLDRILNSGAMMRERLGAIRTRIQRQSGGAVAAAGECNGGVGCT